MAKLTDREIVAAIESEESQALGWYSGELADRRASALNAWLAGPLGNEVEGRSQVVSASVRDTIESVMPSLARVFLSGDDIGRFEPLSEEDEQGAQMESDVCSWYIERGGGWTALYSAMHDALLLGNGYIKAWWKTDSAITTETYTGYTDEDVALLAEDPDVEIVEHTAYTDPATGMALHDIKVERVKPLEYVALEAVPPDEILVSRRHRYVGLADVDFVQHRREDTIGNLRAQGYDIDDDVSDDHDPPMQEQLDRDRYQEADYEDDTGDPTRRRVTLRETWMRLDVRGKGEPQLWRICVIGKSIIHQEEADLIPVAAFAPLIYPHSHIGTSYFDLIADLTLLETAVQRQLLDNLYLSNNARIAADDANVNLEDLLVSRPGGVVRTQGPPGNSVLPLLHPDTSGSALKALEYVHNLREERTGVTRYNQGLDANSLNKTATGVSLIQSAAAGRQEIIARTIAEGVRELFLIVHALASKHSTREIQAKIKNTWVRVNPREWVRRTDFKTSVALGTGAPEQQLAKWAQFMAMVPQLMGMGLMGPANLFEMVKEMFRLGGYRSVNKFLIEPDPQQPPPQPGPPPEVMAAQVVSQGTVQKAQIDGQIALTKASQEAQTDLQREQVKQQWEYKRALLEVAKDAMIEVYRQQAQAGAQMREMEHSTQLEGMRQSIDASKEAQHEASERNNDAQSGVMRSLEQMAERLAAAVEQLGAPKRVVRDQAGRAVGIETVR